MCLRRKRRGCRLERASWIRFCPAAALAGAPKCGGALPCPADTAPRRTAGGPARGRRAAHVMETLIDGLAVAAGRDPWAFRRSLLGKSPRAAAVLKRAAGKAGWGKPRRAGVAQGIAVHESFDSFVAQVAEVSMRNGKVRVERVVCAIDCGVPVNPDVIRAQMEGCIGFALGALYYSEIDIKEGRAAQRNFDTYRALRIYEMPRVEVHIMPSTEKPGGVDRKSTRLNSSHSQISYAVFCLKKKKN